MNATTQTREVTARAQGTPQEHVFTKGGDHDLRVYRRTWSRRKSSGVTMCGAPAGPLTFGRKTGEARLLLPHWRAGLCPECARALDAALASQVTR